MSRAAHICASCLLLALRAASGAVFDGAVPQLLRSEKREHPPMSLLTDKGKAGRYWCERKRNVTATEQLDYQLSCASRRQAASICADFGLRLCAAEEIATAIGEGCSLMYTLSSETKGYAVGNGNCWGGDTKGKLLSSDHSSAGSGFFDAACCDIPDPSSFNCLSDHETFDVSGQCQTQKDAEDRCRGLGKRLCDEAELHKVGQSCFPMFTSGSADSGSFVSSGEAGCPVAKGESVQVVRTPDVTFAAACCDMTSSLSGIFKCSDGNSMDAYLCENQTSAAARCSYLAMRLCEPEELLLFNFTKCKRVYTADPLNQMGYFVGSGECASAVNDGQLFTTTRSWRGLGKFDAACCPTDGELGVPLSKRGGELLNAIASAD